MRLEMVGQICADHAASPRSIRTYATAPA